MDDQTVTQATLVSKSTVDSSQETMKLALFNANGTPVNVVQSTVFAPVTSPTAVATVAKTTTSVEPVANSIVAIKFTNGNTAASPTVSFNGGAARAVQLGGVAPAAIEITLGANGVALFWFDGTVLHQVGVYS